MGQIWASGVQNDFLRRWRTPWWSVAVSTIRFKSVRSLAFLQAEWIPMLTDRTPVSDALSQLVRGRPLGLLQWLGGQSDAPMTRCWSCSGSTRATCRKKWNRLYRIRWGNWRTSGSLLDSKVGDVCLVDEIRRILRRERTTFCGRTNPHISEIAHGRPADSKNSIYVDFCNEFKCTSFTNCNEILTI